MRPAFENHADRSGAIAPLSEISGVARVVSGAGCWEVLLEWIRRTADPGGRVALVTGERIFQRGGAAAALAGEILAGSPGSPHFRVGGEPDDRLVDRMVKAVRRTGGAAAVVSVGGGSALDAGKALAAMLCEEGDTMDFLEGVGTCKPSGRMLPWFAAPTTAGTGSEATTNAVLSRPGLSGFKRSLRHASYRAAGVVLDARLAVGAPALQVAASGMDAFTQLFESWSSRRVPADLEPWLESALVAAYRALPGAVAAAPDGDHKLTGILLEAAFLSGVGLTRAGLGTTHGLAGTIGAVSRAPHGIACARLMGPAIRETLDWLVLHSDEPPAAAALEKCRRLGRKLSSDGGDWWNPFYRMAGWAREFGVPPLGIFRIGRARFERILQAANDRESPAALGRAAWERILHEAIGREAVRGL